MKKTLALALVAAMTISMVSMTAFAKDVKYNTQTDVTEPEAVVATVTLKKKDLKENKDQIIGYTAKDDIGPAISKGDEVSLEDYAKLGENQSKCEPVKGTTYTITFGDLGLKKYDNTATKTFFGWVEGDDSSDEAASLDEWSTTGEDPANKDKVLKDNKTWTYTVDDTEDLSKNVITDTSVIKLYFLTVGRTDTDDETIAKNLKAIEDKKNGGDAAQKEEDRLAELDKKYNADGKNAYDKEKKDVEGEVTFTEKKKAADSMDDFYYHAAKVAGVSTDADKTWVYDITMKDGQKLYEGKNQRVTLELNGVNKDADLSKFGVKVYHVEGWCKATQIKNVDVKGNKVTFWTNSFSPYVITIGDGVASTGAADASNPSTGDFSAVPVALLAAAALGATGFVAYKKRKAE